MKQLHIIDSGLLGALENMEIDQGLLATLEETPLLRFYGWRSPSITYGHFVDPEKFLKVDVIEAMGWEMARRPTGGGIIFHPWDFTFSFLLPASHPSFSLDALDNYIFVNSIVAESLEEISGMPSVSLLQKGTACIGAGERFCMAQPTIYDLMWHGKKVGGAAQRRTKKGYLHQGSISLYMPDQEILEKILVDGPEVTEKMLASTCAFSSIVQSEDLPQMLKKMMIESFSEILDMPFAIVPFPTSHIAKEGSNVEPKKL
jgi:lipoate---protein ligase